MFGIVVDFEFVVYCMVQWVFWQYVFYGDFDYVFGVGGQQIMQVGGFEVVDVVCEMVVLFVVQFGIGDGYFLCVDYDDVIVGVYVWGEFWFVFVVQVVCNFGGQMIECFVCGVDYELVVFDVFWFGVECFYFGIFVGCFGGGDGNWVK